MSDESTVVQSPPSPSPHPASWDAVIEKVEKWRDRMDEALGE